MFTRVEFHNFKALREYSVLLKNTNVLTGANNAGKSTVLDAFRALSGALRYASRHLPDFIKDYKGRTYRGYKIPHSYLPITMANIQTDYASVDATIIFHLDNRYRLTLLFDEEQNCRLLLDPDAPVITSLAKFRKNYPVTIAIIPTLGPLEEEEALLSEEYVAANEKGRRSHRIFRNIWYQRRKEFDELKNLVAETWPGMELEKPELAGYGDRARVQMFCSEDHRTREVYWAGFGFQVWLQFLSHVLGVGPATTLIIDEPDIYLHPDLQHKLFHILKANGRQFLLATHSIEIINEAEYDEVVLINKKQRSAKRMSDVDDLQAAMEALGSSQNIHLNRLSRGRKVLFFEGQDFRMYKRFAQKLGCGAVATGLDFNVVPIGGYSESQKVENAVWTFRKILETDINVAAVFDRDYRSQEQVDEFLTSLRAQVPCAHVLDRKEIENYLLDLVALEKCIFERSKNSVMTIKGVSIPLDAYVKNLLKRATATTKQNTRAQFLHTYLDRPRGSISRPTHVKNGGAEFDGIWKTLSKRMCIVPGKEVLSAVNRLLQEDAGMSVTSAQLIKNMPKDRIPPDLCEILYRLEDFAAA